MRISIESYKRIEELLNDYVEVKCEIACECEAAERGEDIDIYVIESRVQYYLNKGNKHGIKVFNIDNNYDYDELLEYEIYLSNKIAKEIKELLRLEIQYPNIKQNK